MQSRPVRKGEVVLIRHGETPWSLSGQHTGRTDLPLTENGCRVAKLLEPLFSDVEFARVLASPLERARMTCELSGLGARMQIDPDLCEWNYGEYEGLTPEEIEGRSPGWIIFTDGCPGGETPAQVRFRVDRLIQAVRAAPGRVALFAHGHLFRVFVARWLGLPVSHACHFVLNTSTLSLLGYYRGIPSVKCWNAPIEEERFLE